MRHVYRMAGGISKKVGVREGWAWNWPEQWGERGGGGEESQAQTGSDAWGEVGKSVAIVRCVADIYDEEEDENRAKSPCFSQDGQIGAGNFRGVMQTQKVVDERGDLMGGRRSEEGLCERKKRLEQIRREKAGRGGDSL